MLKSEQSGSCVRNLKTQGFADSPSLSDTDIQTTS